MPPFVEVVFNNPLRDRFTYRIPQDWESPPPLGSRVLAKFGRRPKQLGFVVGHTDQSPVEESRIVELDSCLDEEPILHPLLMELLEWVAEYYCSSFGEALFAAFPFGAKTSFRSEKVLSRGENYETAADVLRLTEKRLRAMECFENLEIELSPAEVRAVTGVGQGVLDSLVDARVLRQSSRLPAEPISGAESLYRSEQPVLNQAQQSGLSRISEILAPPFTENEKKQIRVLELVSLSIFLFFRHLMMV